jgi:ATPase subunit of ABC transporter with duplicated ATPase domains
MFFASHDHQLVATVANRIIELFPNGFIDRSMCFDDYLENEEVARQRAILCPEHAELNL